MIAITYSYEKAKFEDILRHVENERRRITNPEELPSAPQTSLKNTLRLMLAGLTLRLVTLFS